MKGLIDCISLEQRIARAATPAEGCRQVVVIFREAISQDKLSIANVSLKQLGLALGAVDKYDIEGTMAEALTTTPGFMAVGNRNADALFSESAGLNVHTNAFKVITGELIGRELIRGYESVEDVSDKLCRVITNQRVRNQRVPGFTSVGEPREVKEGHPYPETGFEEKYIVTEEKKYGELLSVPMELLLFDQTGMIQMRANDVGMMARDFRQRLIINGVVGATDSFRPSGVAETLYSSSNLNLIGSGGVTGFTSAVALSDWTDIDTVRKMRATVVTDDRIDGTKRPIGMINTGENVLIVPEGLAGTARAIYNQTEGRYTSNSAVDTTIFEKNPMRGIVKDVISSPHIDNALGNSTTWFYGDPKKQFLWTEVYPVRTWVQGADSESAFERDTYFRVKVGFYGGLSATDSIWVTKILGT